ncbi:MAG: MFS transporter [Pseudomonadota bacterium]|nr:MFS transporter [Pseudomonadota bacterium]
MSQLANTRKSWFLPTVMWLMGALSFLLQYACRIAPSSFLEAMQYDFGFDATSIGMVGVYFLLPYIFMQLFVGRIVDKFPAHHVLIGTTLIFFLSNQLFSESLTVVDVAISRCIMGAVGAFAFVVTMKLALIWFENRFLGILAGLTQVSGMLGAVFGGQVVDMLMIDQQWRPAIKMLSLLMGVLILLMVLIMRDKPGAKEASSSTDVSILDGLSVVWRNPQSWFNGLYAGLIYLPTAAFGEHWGKLYLAKTNAEIGIHQATFVVSMIFIGWAIGGIVSGYLSDRMGRRKPLMLLAPVLCAITLLPAIYIHTLSAWTVGGLLGLYGVFNSPLVLAYALSGEINPARVSGVSIAFCNMSSILLGAATMPIMGMLMDSYATVNTVGTKLYTVEAYEAAVICFPIALCLAFLCATGIKETYCQQNKS